MNTHNKRKTVVKIVSSKHMSRSDLQSQSDLMSSTSSRLSRLDIVSHRSDSPPLPPPPQVYQHQQQLQNPSITFHDATSKLLIKRRKSRYEQRINAIWELFSDYSNTSSIHGVKYLGEKKRHWSERIWWIIAFALSLIVCGKLIIDTWHKWDRFPVIVTFAEKSTPVWDIPFPSVTICPETKSKQSVLNYTNICNKLEQKTITTANLSYVDLENLKAAAKVCRDYLPQIMLIEGKYSSKDVYERLQKLAPSLSEVLYNCEFNRQERNCKKLFSEIWTEEGLCFTFNSLNSTELYKKERFSSEYPMVTSHTWHGVKKENEAYPFRVFGASDGLFVYLRLYDKDIDYLCGGAVQGFKVLLHTAGEIPQISKYFYRVPLDQEVIVSIKPILMTTSESLRHYTADRRQCYFESERILKYLKVYTQRNCELECIANYTVKRCGCASFAQPRDNGTKICGLEQLKCYRSIEQKISKRDAAGNMTGCGCLPACSSISYDAELTFSKYELREFYRAKNRSFINKRQYARLFISFKDNQFFASRRSELYGKADFLANCGGLLGLFMGFSLLSLVEIIYYCTLRLGCNLKRRRQRKKQRLSLMNSTQNLNKENRY